MEEKFTLERPFSGVKEGDFLYFVDGYRIYRGKVEDMYNLDDGITFRVDIEDKCTVYLNVPADDVNEYSVPVVGFDECFSDVKYAVDTTRARIRHEISKWNGMIEYLNSRLTDLENLLENAD